MFSGYFVWWYGTGLIQAYQIATSIMAHVTDFFSLPILFRTLFAPWKNDVTVARNLSLADQLKVWQMNFVGRFIGFLVRSVVIVVALLILFILVLAGAAGLVIWLLGPPLVIILPLLGVGRLF